MPGSPARDSGRSSPARAGRALAARGARLQRPLWASTGTKDPSFARTIYFDALVAPDTVNTMPDDLVAAPEHRFESRIEEQIPAAKEILARIPSFSMLVAQLQVEGLASFHGSWQALVAAIEAKRPLARMA